VDRGRADGTRQGGAAGRARSGGAPSPDVSQIVALRQEGESLRAQGHYAEAAAVLDDAVALARGGGEQELLAETLIDMGAIESSRGRVHEAEVAFASAHEILKARAGDTHRPRSLVAVLNGLARVSLVTGSVEEGMEHARTACATAEALLGPGHVDTLSARATLARLEHVADAGSGSASVLREILAAIEASDDEAHAELVVVLLDLAHVHRDAFEFASARTFSQRALDINRRLLGESHPALAESLQVLGDVLLELGEFGDASVCLVRARELLHGRVDALHPVLGAIAASMRSMPK